MKLVFKDKDYAKDAGFTVVNRHVTVLWKIMCLFVGNR